MADCPVCYDKYTSHLRKKVSCAYCDFAACNICCKKYLTEGLMDAHCMSCRRAWNDEFLDLNFTKSFRTGQYRKHREIVLMDREISLLPTRQPRVEAKIKLDEAKNGISAINEELRIWEAKRAEIVRKSSEFTRKITRYSAEFEGRAPPAWTLREGEKAAPTEKAKFIMKCPDVECRGFLSTAYKCGTCQKWACSDCLVVKGLDKDVEHTCDAGQKESVALIIKESKPCPKCGERISKIDGCDQMFCIECHTAFSWVTGHLVNGVIHNPHYYEFLRTQGNGVAPRNAGDVPCGGVPYYGHLQPALVNLCKDTQTTVMNIHRVTSEIADQRINTYQGNFNINDNGDLGVSYLMKTITKEAMQSELAKRELKRNKHVAIREILEMFVNTSTMMLNNIVSSPPGTTAKAEERKKRSAWKKLNEANILKMAEMEELSKTPNNKLKLSVLQKENETLISAMQELRKEITECGISVIKSAYEEFAPTMIEYENLRVYVNESLMRVSKMKNCSVPQISDSWRWVPFNKCAPKKRVKKDTASVVSSDTETNVAV